MPNNYAGMGQALITMLVILAIVIIFVICVQHWATHKATKKEVG